MVMIPRLLGTCCRWTDKWRRNKWMDEWMDWIDGWMDEKKWMAWRTDGWLLCCVVSFFPAASLIWVNIMTWEESCGLFSKGCISSSTQHKHVLFRFVLWQRTVKDFHVLHVLMPRKKQHQRMINQYSGNTEGFSGKLNHIQMFVSVVSDHINSKHNLFGHFVSSGKPCHVYFMDGSHKWNVCFSEKHLCDTELKFSQLREHFTSEWKTASW